MAGAAARGNHHGLWLWIPGPRQEARPGMTREVYSNPAPRAHLYFAPSTATGISVEYA
jgi:hypothetical protein